MKKDCITNTNWFKKMAVLSMILLTLGLQSFSQDKIVTGTVTSADDGLGIPGVSVVVKGTTVGTSTSIDGKYRISVPSNGKVLVFSFVGMDPAERAVNSNVIDVVMTTDTKQIDEVIVTALGIKRETKALGFAASEVKGDKIAQASAVNPVAALQGQAAGVSVEQSDGGEFGSARINIRGISTLGSNNQPIFVVDGVILDNSTSGNDEWSGGSGDWGNELKNLNSDNFESVTLLKGSAATALYGSRGLNGVVVITTKSNKDKKGLGVSVSQTFGMKTVYDTPDFQHQYGPGTLAGYVSYGEKDTNGEYYKWDTNQLKLNDKGVPTYIGATGLAFGPKFDGRDVIGFDGQLTSYRGYKNNIKDAYETGFSSNTNVTIQGGNETTKFFLSDSYTNSKGTYPNNTFSRNSLLFKGIHNLSEKLNVEASITYTESKPKNATGNLGEYFLGDLPNYYDTKKYKDHYRADHGGVPNSDRGDEYGNVPGMGLWFGINESNTIRKERVIRPIVRLNYNPVKWASFTLEGNTNIYSYTQETKELGAGYKNEGGFYALESYEKRQETVKGMMTLTHEVGDFNGSLMLGGELFKTRNMSTRVKTDGGLTVPGQYFLGNSKKTIIGEGFVGGEKQINSAYFMFNVGWKNQLFLDVTARNDWSSALVYADGTGTNSYFYPSVSSSWIFSETFDLPSWVSFGKLRASWAQVGNDTDPYRINAGYSVDKVEISDGNFAYTNGYERQLIDPTLKPEQKESFSFGTDIRLFNNRVGLDVEYYEENIREQISTIPIPSESGISSMLVNAGHMRNRGIEIALKTTPIQNKDWRWDVDFNWWTNNNKIISLHESSGEYKTLAGAATYGNYRVGSVAYVGGEYGVLLSDSKPQVDKDGNKLLFWSEGGQHATYKRKGGAPEKIGSMLPDFEGSINTSLTFKNFSVSAMFEGRFGGYMASYTNKYGTAYGLTDKSLYGRDEEHGGISYTRDVNGEVRTYHDGIIMEGVFAPNTIVTTPAGATQDISGMSYQDAYDKGYVNPTPASNYHYFNNSWGTSVVNDDWVNEVKYVALRQVAVSYALPNAISKKWGISDLNLSLVGRNLGFLYNSLPNNLNPDSRRGNRSDYNFIERGMTPYTANYSFTIKFKL